MITFKKTVYVAELIDLGYSGEVCDPEFVAYCKTEGVASRIAVEAEGIKSRTGKRGEIRKEEIDIEIFDTLEEYRDSLKDSVLESAMEKLTNEEYAAIIMAYDKMKE